MGDSDDPTVEKARSVIALISALLVPAITFARLLAPLFRKKPKQ